MNKILLIGKTGSGKSSLIQSLQGEDIIYRKTQAITFNGMFVDSPGEFLENRRLYPALMTSSVNCNIIALVQDATAINSVFPPKFASMFKKRMIGIITKIDKKKSHLERAEKFLRRAGTDEIIRTSATENIGLEALRDTITGE
ncbi:MAG: EutP/PduV family microcompartment system protein [Desulfuromusa sp.]|nr:EutP/PduV family microcompartment system protein [Desulfuromusa sp.]